MEMIDKKLIIEYKFAPVLKFSRLMEDFFTSAKIDAYSSFSSGENLVTLSMGDELVNASMKPDTLWISMEKLAEGNLKSSREMHDSIIKALLNNYKIKRLTRVGVRSWHFLPIDFDDFEEAIKWLRKNQFHENAIPLDFPELTDFALTLEGKIKGEHIRVIYGVMTKEEIEKKIPLMHRGNNPNLALHFDCDRYISDRSFPLEPDKVWNMYSKNRKLINKFSNTI